MAVLRVSADLAFPEDAVTRTFVVYGGKGKGKTNFGAVLCEELAKRHLRFCVTDPLDVWWGLQHSKTRGDEPQGVSVVILGGTHGDIPITPDAGEVVADFVADETVNTVIVMRHPDGRMWTNGERVRFMARFARRLFARQGVKRYPLMLVIDEAGRFVPQTAGKGDIEIAECVGAIEELVEWGRNVGLGVALITQRSARMAKAVSELAECMVAFNTVGPLSIGSIVDWFGEHIPRERQHELVEILRKLPVGRALVVSPEWLNFEGEVQIRLRETFDSSATPKAGGALRPPSRARKPDLERYRERMAATAERAKQNDPVALQKRVRELEAELQRKAAAPPRAAATKVVERKVLGLNEIKTLGKTATIFDTAVAKLTAFAPDLLAVVKSVESAASEARASGEAVRASVAAGAHGPAVSPDAHSPGLRSGSTLRPLRSGPTQVGQGDEGRTPGARGTRESAEASALGPGERAVLAAVAQFDEGITRDKLSVLTGYKKSSRDTYLYKLSRAGYVDTSMPQIRATTAGIAALGDAYEPPLTGLALRERWRTKLSGGEREIFEQVLRAYPSSIERDKLSETTSYRKSSRDTYLYKLKARKLIEDAGRGSVIAAAALFDEVA